jgi:SAM-dependent methyltransferase
MRCFDAVLSVYGVHFAPDQEAAADQMLRVCRPGGRIALAGPLPEGWSGDFFATIAKYVPPPTGARSPLRWGTEDGLQALIGSGAVSVHSEKRTSRQYFRSVQHAADVFLAYFGPAIRASAADPANTLREDLTTVFDRYNCATDGTAVIENTYTLTVATRG